MNDKNQRRGERTLAGAASQSLGLASGEEGQGSSGNRAAYARRSPGRSPTCRCPCPGRNVVGKDVHIEKKNFTTSDHNSTSSHLQLCHCRVSTQPPFGNRIFPAPAQEQSTNPPSTTSINTSPSLRTVFPPLVPTLPRSTMPPPRTPFFHSYLDQHVPELFFDQIASPVVRDQKGHVRQVHFAPHAVDHVEEFFF